MRSAVGVGGGVVQPLESRTLLSAAQLVTDLYPLTVSSTPGAFVDYQGAAYFATAHVGPETGLFDLWRTDGTGAAGTTLVTSITATSAPANLTVSNGLLYFAAADAAGTQVWRSDGTAAGTFSITSFTSAGGTSRNLADVGGTLYFTADGPSNARQLWKTLGTAATTDLVSAPNGTTAVSAGLSDLKGLGNALYFVADDGTTGRELWRSDGTVGGTQRVKDISAGTSSAFTTTSPANFTELNGQLFFAARDASFGRELWVTDGSAAGTTRVTDTYAGDGAPTDLRAVNGLIYFASRTSSTARALFVSDGTMAGTTLLKSASSIQAGITNLGATVYFATGSPSKLWATDGTVAGTVEVTPATSGAAVTWDGSSPTQLTVAGSTIYFVASGSSTLGVGREIWSSDGVTYSLLKDINAGSADSAAVNLAGLPSLGGRLIFGANDDVTGAEPWVSDGTAPGTHVLADLDARAVQRPAFPGQLIAGGPGQAFFSTNIGRSGNKGLFVTDGTAAGTVRLSSTGMDAFDSQFTPSTYNGPGAAYVDGALYFSAGNELWRSDGTIPGTRLLKDLNPNGASRPAGFVGFKGRVFFSADDGQHGRELWVTDGTAAGTYMFKDLITEPAGNQSLPREMTVIGEWMYFTGGNGLYRTDGTAAGTTLVRMFDDRPWGLRNFNGTLLFAADGSGDGNIDNELWRSDGTAAGTAMVKDIWPGNGAGLVQPYWNTMEVLPDRMLFIARTSGAVSGTVDYAIWQTDGTAGGTSLVKTLQTFSSGGSVALPGPLRTTGGKTYFVSRSAQELWVTDGTTAGTQLLRSFPANSSVNPVSIVAVSQGKAYLSANLADGAGHELWVSDGTAAGTVLHTEINPGPNSSSPGGGVVIDGRVLFAATNDAYAGAELWKVEQPIAAPTAPAGFTATAVAGNQVRLDWVDASTNETGFRIERSTSATFDTIDATFVTAASATQFVDGSVTPGQAYFYRLVAFNGGGASTPAQTATATTPAAPPPPSNLAATTPADGRVDLTWQDNSSGETGFRVQRSTRPDFATIDASFDVVADATAFSDTSAVLLERYFYRVASVNGAGVSFSPTLAVSVPDRIPTNLQAFPISDTEIQLIWTDTSTSEDQFLIERATGSGPFTQIAQPAAGTQSFINTGRVAGQSYRYRIRETGPAGTSAYSPETAPVSVLPPVLTNPVASLPQLALQQGSEPSAVVISNGVGYFTARVSDTLEDDLVWRTDGTAAGTFPIPVPPSGPKPEHPNNLVDVNGTLYFTATSHSSTMNVWKTDGTAAGTARVSNFTSTNSYLHDLVSYHGALYFRGINTGTGDALWKLDPATNTVSLVKDMGAVNGGAQYRRIVVMNDVMYMGYGGFGGEAGLYRSDGTPEGTVPVVPPGSTAPQQPQAMTVVDGTRLFFIAPGIGENALRVWSSDGTAGGTAPVQHSALNYPSISSGMSTIGALGKYFFEGFDSAGGFELWASDGTTAGTSRVIDAVPGTDGGGPSGLTAFAGQVAFATSNSGSTTTKVWLTDGTTGGTTLLAQFTPTVGQGGVREMTVYGGSLYFAANDAVTGWGIYRIDPATLTPTRVISFAGQTRPGNFAVNVDGMLTFMAEDDYFGAELWETDGTAAGTSRLSDNYLAGPAHPDWLTRLGTTDRFLFTSSDAGGSPRELWASDGTTAGTVMLRNRPASNLVAMGAHAYFTSSDGEHGAELWRSDGTAAGTLMVADVVAGATASNAAPLGTANGLLFFVTRVGESQQLWRSDGTAGGTTLLTNLRFDFFQAESSYNPKPWVASSGGLFYFVNDTPSEGTELWRSDGTAAGTFRISDTSPGSATSRPYALTDVNGTLYFLSYDPTNGVGLWKTTGTLASTTFVADSLAGSTQAGFNALTSFNGRLYFGGTNSANGSELWTSDGTTAGTHIVVDAKPGSEGINIRSIGVAAGRLTIATADGTFPTGGVWLSDGTPGGTYRLRDYRLLDTGSNGSSLFVKDVNGTLVYADWGGMWRSNGTTTGTVKVTPYAGSAQVQHRFNGAPAIAIGDQLFYTALKSDGSRELRSISITTPDAPSNLAAASASGGAAIHLTWADNSADESGFVIEASTNADFSVIDRVLYVSADATEFTDPVVADPSIRYRVRAVAAGGASGASNVASVPAAAALPGWLSPGAVATWDPIAHVLTVTGAATISADPAADLHALSVTGPNAALTIDVPGGGSSGIRVGAINLSNGARLALVAHGAGAVRTLVVNGNPVIDATGYLDLTDNAMIVLDGTASAIQSSVGAGYNGGSWNGLGGITSSTAAADSHTAIGFGSNGVLTRTSYAGVTGLTNSAVLVKYTYAGDANLDGQVDIGDLGLLAGAWQQPSGKSWFEGDFTYNGAVDIGDLGLLSGNWQKGVGNPI